jgi:hypothetical protein
MYEWYSSDEGLKNQLVNWPIHHFFLVISELYAVQSNKNELRTSVMLSQHSGDSPCA